MARIRIGKPTPQPTASRAPLRTRTRTGTPRAPVREPEPVEEYEDERPQDEYDIEDNEVEGEVLQTRQSSHPRAPMHGPRLRGYRDQPHVADHGQPRRTRRRKATIMEDVYYIPLDEIPEGLSYEWKRWSVAGQEDPFYIAQMREQGWEPVPPKRHPNWVPPGYSEPYIIKGGMILMDRPIELTDEARAELRVLAKQQVKEAEARLGRTPGNTLNRLAPKITKEIMRQVPVED